PPRRVTLLACKRRSGGLTTPGFSEESAEGSPFPAQWSDYLSAAFDASIGLCKAELRRAGLSGPVPFYNPRHGAPGDEAPHEITWTAFPRRIQARHGTNRHAALQDADRLVPEPGAVPRCALSRQQDE